MNGRLKPGREARDAVERKRSMDEDIMWAIVAIVIWAPPALALSIRFALKPIVEAIARLREGSGPGTVNRVDPHQLSRIEEQLARLSDRLDSIERVEAFHRELGSGRGAVGRPGGSAEDPRS